MRRAALPLGVLALLGSELVPDRPLVAHMVEHLLMTIVAAPLIAAGSPVRVALRRSGPDGRRQIARLLRSRTVRVLGRPQVAFLAFVAVTLGVHLPGFFDPAERHPALHAVEHMLLFGSAYLLWMHVIGDDPLPHRPGWFGRCLLVLGAMPAMTLVGVDLDSAGRVIYPVYAGPHGLADQHAAGTIMWVIGTGVAGAWLLAALWDLWEREERRQLAREARL